MTSEQIIIRRLTLRLPNDRHSLQGRDEAAIIGRSRLERLLNELNWQPSGYRPGHVWVIRRLALIPPLDPRHRHQWTMAVESMLNDLFRRAIRVKPGMTVGSAEQADSLLFEDRAEWLALLTSDTLDGSIWTRWYWQAALTEQPMRYPGALLAAVWQRFAEHLPAALALLPADLATRAVAQLAPVEVSMIARALHERYALPRDIFAVSIPDVQKSSVIDMERPAAPWERWLSQPTTLRPQACYLYGLLVTLSRAPGYARSATFAYSAATWLEHTLAHERHPRPSVPRRLDPVSPAADRQPRALSRSSDHDRPANAAVEQQTGSALSPDPTSAAPNRDQLIGSNEADSPVVDPPTFTPTADAEIRTALGGVVFLIHALAWLDLPELHEEHIGAWAWLDVVARALLGAAPADPIWDVLRRLDGRAEDTLIGAGWQPHEFRLSRRTVQRYLRGAWRASCHDGRLILARGEIVVLDTPMTDTDTDATIAAAIRAYDEQNDPRWEAGGGMDSFVVPSSLRMVADDAMIDWIARAMPCLLHLLRRAFGDPTLSIDDIARRLLTQPARVAITRTHIDMVLPLDSADILLRRAGLDRNPGWLPAYGYIVQFHFS